MKILAIGGCGSMARYALKAAQNFDAIDSAIRYGQQLQNTGNKNQVDLFSNGTNIFLITLVLTCLIFLSKKVRTLGQQLINAVK